jgi:hypothetical protein
MWGLKVIPMPIEARSSRSVMIWNSSSAPPAVADGQALDLLGKRPPRAAAVVAEQPPHRQHDHHPPDSDQLRSRNVGQIHPEPTSTSNSHFDEALKARWPPSVAAQRTAMMETEIPLACVIPALLDISGCFFVHLSSS